MAEDIAQAVRRAAEKNFQRLIAELRRNQALSKLVAKAAKGKKLDSEERAKLKDGLLDIAKMIPALAIFAAPGGILLLAALAKVLPSYLLPHLLQEDGQELSSKPP